ncbi:MAG: nucleotidyltransferase family protein [Francisellaceae bacterium]
MHKMDWHKCTQQMIALLSSNGRTIDLAIIESDTFAKCCEYHRLLPRVTQALNNISTSVSKTLLEKHKKASYDVFVQIQALHEIIKTFLAHDIDLLVFKGLQLSQLLYDNLCLRQAKDIDILVNTDKVILAAEQLSALGYALCFPACQNLSERQHHYLLKHAKDMTFYHPQTRVTIELGTRAK